jgi:triacylglycerol lipase
MPVLSGLDRDTAIFLAGCIEEAYQQYQTGGSFQIPNGFRLVTTFTGTALLDPEPIGYIIESDLEAVLVFRGTATPEEWLRDLEFRQVDYEFVPLAGKTHAGFTAIYQSARERILNAIRRVNSWKQLLITGHSLGGALATLAALDLAVNTPFAAPVMINFGSPRVGDPEFANVYNDTIRNSLRMVNLFDPVPRVPFERATTLIGKETVVYRHVDAAYLFMIHGGNLRQNHSLRVYLEGLGVNRMAVAE